MTLGEIKKDLDIYLAIQRYARAVPKKDEAKKLLNYSTILAFVAFLSLVFIGFGYAQTGKVIPVSAPEPGTVALVSTGIFGCIVRFARKRFTEFKRIFDILVASIGIVIASPVMALTAIYIKIVSPGPVIFSQERVGWKGNMFNIYKMRTMRLDAEKLTGPVWAKENDSRLIKHGSVIRKLHLDELPQLFNVLKGEMSIVGPRPERPVFVEQLSEKIPDYRRRLEVKPGITGLAQVWHKYDETIQDVKKKVKYDLLYIREMCLMVDVRILLRTIVVSFQGRGAR